MFQLPVYLHTGQKLILSDVFSALLTEDKVASKWKLFAHHLKVEMYFIRVIEEACQDSFSRSYGAWHGISNECLYHLLKEWLYEEKGTGDLPRTWDTIVTALESLRKQIRFSEYYNCIIIECV